MTPSCKGPFFRILQNLAFSCKLRLLNLPNLNMKEIKKTKWIWTYLYIDNRENPRPHKIRMFLKAHLHIFFTWMGLPSGIPPTHETSESSHRNIRMIFHFFVSWRREGARKGLNAISGAQFAALPLVKPVVWFARVVVNWRSRSIAKSAYYQLTKGKRAERIERDFRCSICCSPIGQAICLICARRRQLTFPFYC